MCFSGPFWRIWHPRFIGKRLKIEVRHTFGYSKSLLGQTSGVPKLIRSPKRPIQKIIGALFKNQGPSLLGGFSGGQGKPRTPSWNFWVLSENWRDYDQGPIWHNMNRHLQLGDNTDHPINPLDLTMLLKFLHSYNVKQAGAGCTRRRTNGRHVCQLQGSNNFGPTNQIC